MKKLLSILIISVLVFACNPETEDNKKDLPSDTTEIVNNDTDGNKSKNNDVADEKSDENEISKENLKEKTNDVLKKTEDINNKLDSILNNL